MVAFISALGYGFGETIARLSGWPRLMCTVALSDPEAKICYSADGATPAVTVSMNADGKTVTLQAEKDYKVSYSGNKKVGSAAYAVSFLGSYKGHKAITKQKFTIEAALRSAASNYGW